MAAAKIEETVCEDMISALPEDLLVTILLLLPIKDAVATMILSKRWRFVWTMLPRLEYQENGDGNRFSFYLDNCENDDESKKSIWWFLEKSMELHRAPVLQNLLIKLGPRCPSDADVGKWLIKAVDRGIVFLKLKLCWSTGPTRLPKSLYTCETLEQLTLSHKILVDFPSSSCLPSLNFLGLLCVVYRDEDSLVRFLSSCPVLEILNVKRDKNHDNVTKFSVKVPSLRYLRYDNRDYTLPSNDAIDTSSSLVIDTPALIHLEIISNSRDSWSIANMPDLETAHFYVKSFPYIEKSKTFLSRVSSLELFMTNEVLARCSTVNFSRLTRLQIYPCNSDWLEPLLLFIENSPELKDLLVNYEFTLYPDKIPLSWSQPSSIPRCMSSHLEIFEYIQYGHRKEEEEFLTYLLANSKCLKTVTISVSLSFDQKEKELIIEDLKNIPRVSTPSQLLFK